MRFNRKKFSTIGCCFCFMKRRIEYEDPVVLASQTCFTVNEVKALFELFKRLSSSLVDDGVISKEEFQLGLFRNSKHQNLFADRIFNLFDSKNDEKIDFGEFIRALSVFHPDAPQSQKVDFSFRLYNIRQTGFIESEEVKEMILALFRESDLIVSDDIIKDIIDKTFQEADYKGDGKIDQEEWKEFVAQNPSLLKNMTIPYLKDMVTVFPSFVMRSEIVNEIDNFFD